MVMTESDQMGCVLLSAASALKYGRAVVAAAEGAAVELRAVHARMAA